MVTVGQDQVVNVVVAFTSCTDAHSRANVLTPMNEALQNTCELIKTAKADGRSIQAYASMAFYCPYEGAVDPKNVATVIEGYVEAGADKIILADTLGQALPSQITETLAVAVEAGASMEQLGLHLHDAHHKAHANVIAAIEAGVRHFDCATSGCGGCNFVPDAEGNISIQTLLWVSNLCVPCRKGATTFSSFRSHNIARLLGNQQHGLSSCGWSPRKHPGCARLLERSFGQGAEWYSVSAGQLEGHVASHPAVCTRMTRAPGAQELHSNIFLPFIHNS